MATKDIDVVKLLSKVLGEDVVITKAEDYDEHWKERLPVGIFSLDVELMGGLPRGTVCQIHGPEGAGKDLISNYVMASAQKMFREETNILWLSFGYAPDIDFMRLCGCTIGGDGREENTTGNVLIVDLARTKGAESSPSEKLLTAAIEAIKLGSFQLVIINELASGETKDNVKKGLDEEAKMATWAKLMADFSKKFYSAIRVPLENGERNLTTVIVLNPARANLDAFTSKFSKTVQTSGHAVKHLKAIDLHLKPGERTKNPAGKEIKWKLAKAKHGRAEGAEGSFYLVFGEGVDIVKDIVNTAIAHGVIKKKGGKYYVPQEDSDEDYEVIGLEETYSYFTNADLSDPEELEFIKQLTLQAVKRQVYG